MCGSSALPGAHAWEAVAGATVHDRTPVPLIRASAWVRFLEAEHESEQREADQIMEVALGPRMLRVLRRASHACFLRLLIATNS
jgi:hypothetical protein